MTRSFLHRCFVRPKPIELMKKMGRSSEAALYSYTCDQPKTNRFYKWIKAAVGKWFKKIKATSPAPKGGKASSKSV
jgi:hypothetical protein